MKITKVKCWREDLELSRPYTIAYRTIDSVDNVFLWLELENGQQGIGAGSPAPMVTGETIEQALAALQETATDLLVGQDIRHFRKLLRAAGQLLPGRPAARAAIDIALHDAFTHWLGVPLCVFLGQVHQAFRTSVTIGIQPLDQTLEEGRAFVRQGFRVIKLKTGRRVEEDIEAFCKLREAVGPDILIRVDANQGYQPADLLRFAAATRHCDLEFTEQPFPPGQIAAMQALPPAIRRACAADEDLHGPAAALRMAAEPQPYGIYNIKLMKCGGIQPAGEIASIAHLAGIDLMWGCNDESAVSIAAALHLALASPATRYIDLDGSLDLARDLVTGGFELRDGWMYPLNRPGLGVTLVEVP